INGKISSGVVAVEDVEELRERINLPALAELERPRDAHIHLNVGRPTEFVETGGLSVHINAAGVVQVGDGDGSSALKLRDAAQLETAGEVHRTGKHEAMTNIFARRTIVAGSKSIQRITHAIHIVKEFAQQAPPGLRLGERIVRHQIEAAHVALKMQHQRVVTGTVVGLEHIHTGNYVRLIGGIVRV